MAVITGRNESGKSTLLEAYCAALHARSLRGASPWRGQDTNIGLALPRCHVVRTPESLSLNGSEALKPSKKQPDVVSLVGTWETFQRTRCFDADLSSRFGACTDSERKRILEQLCGLDSLDDGLKRCRHDIKEIERNIDGLKQKIAISNASIPINLTKPDSSILTALAVTIQQYTDTMHKLARDDGKLLGAAQAAEQKQELFQSGHCPTCEQPIPSSKLSTLRDIVTQARRERAEAQGKRTSLSDDTAQLQARLRTLQHEQAEAERIELLAAKYAQESAQRATVASELEAKVKTLNHLKSVEQFIVYVRPILLRSSLASLETAAQRWLSVLTDKQMSLKLVDDDVRLTLGARNYKELNRGHRRRIDLCLMFGLSALHTAPVRGPIWLDEICDGLDADGCEAAATVFEAVAAHELVILLTHSSEMAGRLRGIHIEVLDGQCKIVQNARHA